MDLRNIEVRRIAEGDAPALFDFYSRLNPESLRTFRPLGTITTVEHCRVIADHNHPAVNLKHDLIAWTEGTIAGWAFLWAMDTNMPMLGIAVAEEHRGRKLGSLLMGAIMDVAKRSGKPKVHLTVALDNQPARALYTKHGFVPTATFRGMDGRLYEHMMADLSSS